MTDETDYDAARCGDSSASSGERGWVGRRPPVMPGAKLAPDYFALVRKFCFGMFWSRPNLALAGSLA